ncbi:MULTISPECIES: GntR family transcriptional regulator [Kitasatospora]|uniref:Putative GntR family transcriptional regulator n=1 Tax=Kitasatospora setae (strain ATCC 33774 / DSM 43861 / JCM 3304 / KCC A-0304 / NBRC 14216 / KM-6054) TaxID=452652 RepID=E4MZ81_KITSK|nr:putative GntR family transcriptional regulator [Kitasatospora setae KM-6054]
MTAAGSGGGRALIRRHSLREQIAEALRDEMMAGRLPAGRNFTVKEIADIYGVSATPAREALVDLAAQGLLVTEPHRGFTVPEFTWADFLEIFEARTLLTDNALRHLAARGEHAYDWSRLPSLRRRADAAARAARAGQLDVLVGCDLRFWQEAAGVLCNDRIADYLGWLRIQSWMFAAPHLRAAGAELAGVCWDRHGELVDRIEARDRAGAHRIVNEYNLFTIELLARRLGESLDGVAVLRLLREPAVPAPASAPASAPVPAPASAAPSSASADPVPPAAPAVARPTGIVPQPASATVGLGLVPMPRFVPPGRFARSFRPGSGEPAAGR